MKDISISTTFLSGAKKVYTAIKKLELFSSLDSPVVSLNTSIITDSFAEDIKSISLLYNGKSIFKGKLDLQSSSVGAGGSILKIEARSKAASLLDNEAMPCTLWGANLSTVFLRHVGKFGFSLENTLPAITLPMYTIHKGMSEWDSFSLFCKNLHGIAPYIINDWVFTKRITPKKNGLVFSNSGSGINFTSLTHTLSPYNIVSKYYLRDEQGQYSSSVKNSAADYYNVQRERYLLPSNDLIESSGAGTDANNKIRKSMSSSESWVIETPELILPDITDTVNIKDTLLYKQNLIINSIKHSISERGNFTTLELKNSIYL